MAQDPRYGVKIDYQLMLATAAGESGFNPRALSHKGAAGLYQIRFSTAGSVHINPNDLPDPDSSALGAARYFANSYKRFKGDEQKMMISYIAGYGGVERELKRPNGDGMQYYKKFSTILLYLREKERIKKEKEEIKERCFQFAKSDSLAIMSDTVNSLKVDSSQTVAIEESFF